MLTREKELWMRGKYGDVITDDILAGIQTTEKAADEAGVAYKEAPAEAGLADEIRAVLKEHRGELEGLKAEIATLKAASFGGEPEVKAELPPDELEQGLEGDPLLTEPEMMNDDELVAAISTAVVQALTPMLNLETKMGKMMDEFKASLGGVVAQKDDQLATVAETQTAQAQTVLALEGQIATLQTQLKELRGEQPTGAPGYIASQQQGTDPSLSARVKAHQQALASAPGQPQPTNGNADLFFLDMIRGNGRSPEANQ